MSIFDIKPNQVSRDSRSYSYLIYGGPKVGKTTLATSAEGHLLLAFEKGYAALPGVIAQPVNSWGEFLRILNELENDYRKRKRAEAKGEEYEQRFKTIIIDIADIAYDYCEKYIAQREGVESIEDLKYGVGHRMTGKEFDDKLRSIVQMDYGLILISHATFSKDPNDDDITVAAPSMAKRPKELVTRLVDVISYISMETTEEGIERVMHFRQTPEWLAGSRFKYIKESAPLGYQNMVDAVVEAIDKEAEVAGVEATDDTVNLYKVKETASFEEVREQIDAEIKRIMSSSGSKTEEFAARIVEITDNALGTGRKIGDTTEHQLDQLLVILDELKEVVE